MWSGLYHLILWKYINTLVYMSRMHSVWENAYEKQCLGCAWLAAFPVHFCSNQHTTLEWKSKKCLQEQSDGIWFVPKNKSSACGAYPNNIYAECEEKTIKFNIKRSHARYNEMGKYIFHLKWTIYCPANEPRSFHAQKTIRTMNMYLYIHLFMLSHGS